GLCGSRQDQARFRESDRQRDQIHSGGRSRLGLFFTARHRRWRAGRRGWRHGTRNRSASSRTGVPRIRASRCIAIASSSRNGIGLGDRPEVRGAALGKDLGGERARKRQSVFLYLAVESSSRLMGARILIVEDSVLVTDAFRVLFEEAGYDVDVAASVAEGLSRASAAPVDVLLLDLSLPDGSGLDIVDALRTRGSLP